MQNAYIVFFFIAEFLWTLPMVADVSKLNYWSADLLILLIKYWLWRGVVPRQFTYHVSVMRNHVSHQLQYAASFPSPDFNSLHSLPIPQTTGALIKSSHLLPYSALVAVITCIYRDKRVCKTSSAVLVVHPHKATVYISYSLRHSSFPHTEHV